MSEGESPIAGSRPLESDSGAGMKGSSVANLGLIADLVVAWIEHELVCKRIRARNDFEEPATQCEYSRSSTIDPVEAERPEVIE